ncbi:7390_t:CDS:2 [Funneliformis geosporum]|uniref:7390_t:CDS:1 n=1 Tax=Funneliformis geosporum TaxID=1117311 RepID=A0A9W4SGM0_9GLOM|nr:7390_t:CDS:2 [Funneliformis geosporum]
MSNNPFLAEENKNHHELGSSVAAPPPAYDDVVKPGYNYGYPPNNQSYSPPSFSPPTVPVAENHNYNPIVTAESYQTASANPSEKAANDKACNQIKLNDIPEKFTFDPNLILKLNVDDSRRQLNGVNILQNPSPEETNVIVEVFTGSSDRITPQFETKIQFDSFELKVFQKVGFGVFNIPPRCMLLKINVILPQVNAGNPIPNNIQVKNLNLKLVKDENNKPYQQNIGLSTDDGNILLEEINGNIIDIKTREGFVGGSILSLVKELMVSTDEGDVSLFLGNVQNAMVNVQTINGNVGLTMVNSSFVYKVRTNEGRISINDEMIYGLAKNGKAGDGKANVYISTDEGNIILKY